MSRLSHKLDNQERRRQRVRSTVIGTTERPRLSVFISNKHISAQIIDDSKHETIATITTVGQKDDKQTMSQKAVWVGTEIGKKAKALKLKQVVFDRGAKLYHGRVKALADAAREQGLEF